MSIQEACWRIEDGGARTITGASLGLRRESDLCTGPAVQKTSEEGKEEMRLR